MCDEVVSSGVTIMSGWLRLFSLNMFVPIFCLTAAVLRITEVMC